MGNRIIEFIKSKFVLIWAILLTGILLAIYLPTFFNAPRSDWWESLYFFHEIYKSPNDYMWLDVFNTDCMGHVTFRPLAHLVLLIEHIIFGSNFIFMHIINFALYIISILLLYKFATFFVDSKIRIIIALTIFSLLFSHFDVVSWTAHSFVILAFCFFLSGFILYMKFLKIGDNILLYYIIPLFLIAMLCYEAFIFWPLTIILLTYIDKIIDKNKISKLKCILSYIFITTSTYGLYTTVFFLTRSIPTYSDSWAITYKLISELSSIQLIFKSFFATNFNILYNGILVNIFPVIASPAWIDDKTSNIKLGGLLFDYRVTTMDMQKATIIMVLVIVFIVAFLLRKKKKDVLMIFLFLASLLTLFTLTLFHFKYFSNGEYFYNFQQFRYQYIPNAFIVLIVLLFSSIKLKVCFVKKVYIGVFIFFILILNMFYTVQSIDLETESFIPLNTMLKNIKDAIRDDDINENKKLFLNDNIVYSLPSMCWNYDLGRQFMKGTYQWIFNKEEIKYFTNDLNEAFWIISSVDYSVKLVEDYGA